MTKGDVIQFNENHRWTGCLGIISEVKGERIMVGVPMPEKGTAYVFAKESEIEYIGKAAFVEREENE